MDYQLQGDRPIDYFLITPVELQEFIATGDYTLIEEDGEPPRYQYRGVDIVVSR